MTKSKGKTKKARGYAKGTVSQKWGFLRRMLEAAKKAGKIPFNPAVNLSPNGGRRARRPASPLEESKTLNQEELTQVLAIAAREAAREAARWVVVLLALMGLAGLRFGEARALQLGDLELDHTNPQNVPTPRIHVRRTERIGILGPPKHGRDRYVSVTPVLAELLRCYLAYLHVAKPGTIWLFPGRGPKSIGKVRDNFERGGHDPALKWCIAERTARKHLKPVLEAANLGRRLSPKSFRHAFCTIALTQGESLRWVSAEMGHRDVMVTQQVYGRWAQPRGLGKLVEWLSTQDIPERSYYGEPEAAARLALYDISLTS